MVKGGLPEEKTLRLRQRGGAGGGQAKREGGKHSQYRGKLVQRPCGRRRNGALETLREARVGRKQRRKHEESLENTRSCPALSLAAPHRLG